MKQEVTSKKVFIRTLGWPMDVAKTDYGEDSGGYFKIRLAKRLYKQSLIFKSSGLFSGIIK